MDFQTKNFLIVKKILNTVVLTILIGILVNFRCYVDTVCGYDFSTIIM